MENMFLVVLESVINLRILQVFISIAHYRQSQLLQVMSDPAVTCAELSGLLVTCTSSRPKNSGIIKQILRKSTRTLSKFRKLPTNMEKEVQALAFSCLALEQPFSPYRFDTNSSFE